MSHSEQARTAPDDAPRPQHPTVNHARGLAPAWRAWSRAQQTRMATYAELGRVHRAAQRDPEADQAELENHRHRVLPEVLEAVATAAEDLIAALVADSGLRVRAAIPGRIARWWRHRRGQSTAGTLDVALTELAEVFADPWTAREVGAVISCAEIDALAWVLDLAGHTEQASALLCEHARSDDHGDRHAALRPLPGRSDPAPSDTQLLAARAHLGWLHRTRCRR